MAEIIFTSSGLFVKIKTLGLKEVTYKWSYYLKGVQIESLKCVIVQKSHKDI